MRKLMAILILAAATVGCLIINVYADGPFGHADKHGYSAVDVTRQWLQSGQGYIRPDGTRVWVTEGGRGGYDYTITFHNEPGTTYALKNAQKLNSCLRTNNAQPVSISLKERASWTATAWGQVTQGYSSPTLPVAPGWLRHYPSASWGLQQESQPRSTS